MLGKLLAIGSSFDWISPVLSGIQDLANGASHTFLIPGGSGWSGREIDRLLREHGVKTWGAMTVNNTLMLTVRDKQARWADYLLQRSAIPLLNPITSGQPDAAGSLGASSSSHETKRARRGGMLEDLDRMLDSVARSLGL
jgi:hypothetical protein